MIKKIILTVAGILLILTAIPPLSLHVLNFFVVLPPFIGVILIFLPLLKRMIKAVTGRHYKRAVRIIAVVLSAICVFLAFESVIVFINSRPQKAPERAAVIVLGAKVSGRTPTIILQGRINAAGTYLKSHPQAVCIATGGKGSDEAISEAECIKEQLIKQFNIDVHRIYTDTTSVNTQQNFKHALKIIKDEKLSTNVAVATDGFHMFRAKMIASRQGLKPYSCPAVTDKRLLLTFSLRELFALPKSFIADR
ncbi:MAG TPA: YdcF family protein [Ruminiclostridium sp.]|nr:YdcF family protein [Ruminiclostridium sp.]